MKKKILCLALACFMVFMSLPLSALAEDGQTEEKASNEIVNETPATAVENTDDEIVDQNKEAIVPGETEDAVVEKDVKVEDRRTEIPEENPVGIKNDEDLQTEDLTFYSNGGWSYSWSSSDPSRVTVASYRGSEETITVPTEDGGRKIVGVSMSELPNTVKTMIVPEGIESFSLSNAPSLENLSLPSTIKGSVRISNTSLTSLDCLEKVMGLSYLYIIGSKLTDFSALKKFDQLVNLDLSDNPGLTDISVLGQLGQLKHLSLSDNPGIKDISALEKLDQLESLDLRNNSELNECFDFKKIGEA